jgi:DNA-binding NarL/FixJ family response regulator
LIDISLNRGNGFDVLRLLRHRRLAQSATKVVLTNNASAEYRELSMRLGASQFYDKSFEMLKVLELIKMLAAGHATGKRSPVGTDSESHSRRPRL